MHEVSAYVGPKRASAIFHKTCHDILSDVKVLKITLFTKVLPVIHTGIPFFFGYLFHSFCFHYKYFMV